MAELLLVNPRRRKRRKTAKASRRRSRIRAKRRKRSVPVQFLKNPRKRRKMRLPAFVRSRRRSRGASRLSVSGIRGLVNSTVRPAVTAAAGAVLLDAAWAYLPIPAQLKAGPVRHVAKGAGAVALTLIAERVVSRSMAHQFGVGAMTVVLHGAIRELLAQFLPQVRLGDMYYDDYPSLNGLSYVNAGQAMDGLGVYMDPSTDMPGTDPSRMVGDTSLSPSCAVGNPMANPLGEYQYASDGF